VPNNSQEFKSTSLSSHELQQIIQERSNVAALVQSQATELNDLELFIKLRRSLHKVDAPECEMVEV
jgi:hypothetical protein